MGSSISKIEDGDGEQVTTGSVPSTPILTPKQRQIVEEIVDPRSPSLHIIRTPIQNLGLNDPCLYENVSDTFNINSPTIVKKTIEDPRSPTIDFTRTPITVVDESNLLKNLQKRNLNNLKKVLGDIPNHVPPKLLESSPMKPREKEIKRKSFVGLLETNMDFVETDIDVVIMNKSSPRNIKADSPSKLELQAKFLEDLQKQEEETECISKILEQSKQSTNDEVENAPADVNNQTEAVNQRVVDDDGLVIDTPSKNQSVVPVVEGVQETVAETVQEFEKKVSRLIYTEEEHVVTTPKTKQQIIQSGDGSRRTPLGTRNGNNAQACLGKTAPKLRVSDKPRRADYAVSKIPVFKSRNEKQCENTPPKHLEARKPRRAQWDNDNTLII